MGVAIWHFTVFVPDRFWGGIVGAFIGSAAGAMVSGAIAQIAIGEGIGETDLATAFYAVPGALVGLGDHLPDRHPLGRRGRAHLAAPPGRNTGDEGGEIEGVGDLFRICRKNSPSKGRDAAIARLAARQHGVVSVQQLRAQGTLVKCDR